METRSSWMYWWLDCDNISQYIHLSNGHIMHDKYTHIHFISSISVRLEKKKVGGGLGLPPLVVFNPCFPWDPWSILRNRVWYSLPYQTSSNTCVGPSPRYIHSAANLIGILHWAPRLLASISGTEISPRDEEATLFWVGMDQGLLLATHSSTLAWKIPWMEEPRRLQSMGSLRVGHDWVTSLSLFTFMHWRRKWQPTPVFLPGESQGWGSLVGCRLWGCTESDTTEVT